MDGISFASIVFIDEYVTPVAVNEVCAIFDLVAETSFISGVMDIMSSMCETLVDFSVTPEATEEAVVSSGDEDEIRVTS